MLTPSLIADRDAWNDTLRALPCAHVLQTWEWGEFKQRETGWQPERFAYRRADGSVAAAASVLTRRAGPLRVLYVPKGPVLDYADPAKHDAQRGRTGAFAKAVEALRILHQTRTHPEQRVNMISVIADDNLDDVEPLLGQCRDLGITYLVTQYSHSRGSKPARAATFSAVSW